MKKLATIAGLALVASVALAGCGGGSSGGGGGKVTDLGTVELTNALKFNPAQWTGAPGEFKVKLVNKDSVLHDFTISGTNIKFEVKPGETVEKTFKLDKAQKYEVICAQPGHKDGGMKGTLEVK